MTERTKRNCANPTYLLPYLFLCLVLLLLSLSPPLHANVVVVANAATPGSLAVARYYLQKRSIPEANLIVLNTATQETITRETFSATIRNPLLEQLNVRGFIQTTPTKQKDKTGRLRYPMPSHRIHYLVLCYGLPLKIRNAPALLPANVAERLRPAFRTNAASVDTELALLVSSQHPTIAFVDNPLFKATQPLSPEAKAIIKVARLDGSRAEEVKQLIDSAQIGEREGLMGRAYIDRGGPHPKGDAWLERIAQTLQNTGFAVTVETSPNLFPITARCDAPAWYFGWYNSTPQGPFLLPNYRFAPGAIAVHLHSFAATSLRDPDKYWSAGLIARGAAATLGHVYEPYLELTHRLDLFVQRLIAGDTLGEAAYHALPVLSWHAILIGDPLYQPAKIGLNQQIKQIRQQDFSHYGQYAVLRRMRALEQADDFNAALALGQSLANRAPGLAIRLELARRYRAGGNTTNALATLRPASRRPYYSSNEWRLAQTLANTLVQYGDHDSGLALYQKLIESAQTTPPMLKRLLQFGIQQATTAGRFSQARTWEHHLQNMLDEEATAALMEPSEKR